MKFLYYLFLPFCFVGLAAWFVCLALIFGIGHLAYWIGSAIPISKTKKTIYLQNQIN